MALADDFDAVRNDPDPIRRGRRATDLITVYQQRSIELARLRKAAIEEAHHQQGMSYTDIAAQLGITKGRITQIRTTAPGPERAFFGVGPVSVGIPRRYGFEEGRERPYFDANDQAAQEQIEATLARLSLASSRFTIESDREVPPSGDCVIICGPKSAPVARNLLNDDPDFDIERHDDRWWIADSRTGRRYGSPFRVDAETRIDIGYFRRREDRGRVIVHIAGITSIGSLGVARWIDKHVAELFDPAGASVSGIIECDFDADFSVIDPRIILGPHIVPR
ncbi:sigma-70 family RNA polymerase sigma factor [Nocardia abscessus]|uniref:sigma-70 family RNA polymerase sigma factor n=1 Tax=Nocardia abscessus TaxID=120957 RepID=UPI0024537715|nr:sigma-70 family RNA polymerase sigma factor [Nocardia abscessus]